MRRIFFFVVSAGIVAGIIYVYWNYYSPVSEGFKEGRLEQLARKYQPFETFEGVLNCTDGKPFYFSVADKEIADSLSRYVAKPVRLHYVRYRRSLPWRGDNYASARLGRGQDIVDEVRALR
ncbi:MAG: hypothetical protein JSS82_20385 [Bacteroidetes bacterium]|nr:hypothetical protein [Bacteroidota bacterium]